MRAVENNSADGGDSLNLERDRKYELEKFTAKSKNFIADRAWQFVIGSLIALIAGIVIPVVFFFQQEDPKEPRDPRKNQLVIQLQDQRKLTNFPNTVAGRTKILIDGKEEKDVEFFVFTFDYVGDVPARASDFEQPIRAVVARDKKIIAAQSLLDGSVSTRPYRLDKNGELDFAREPQISVDISVTDNHTAEIKPVLLNPYDWFRVEIYTSSYVAPEKLREPEGTTSVQEPATINAKAI